MSVSVESSNFIPRQYTLPKREVVVAPSVNEWESYVYFNRTRAMSQASQETIAVTAKNAVAVANFSDQFDVIIISGKSSQVSRTFLETSGISADKIVTLDPQTSKLMYKLIPGSAKVSQTRKQHLLIHALREKNVVLDSGKSVCVVDEYIDTGLKAEKYIAILDGIDGITDYAFATFSSFMDEKTFQNNSRNNPLSAYLPAYLAKTFIPFTEDKTTQQKTNHFVYQLAETASATHPANARKEPEILHQFATETLLHSLSAVKREIKKIKSTMS